MIGFTIDCVELPWAGWLTGLVFGLLLSLTDVIVTRAYALILGVGAVGGLLICGILQRLGVRAERAQ